MRNTYLIATTIFLFLFQTNLFAQDVMEGIEDLPKKEKGNALSITVEGEVRNVQEVMDQLFKEGTGSKVRPKSGLRMAQGARFGEISSKTLDYMYRVERASRKDKLRSTVTLFISSGNGNYMTSEEFPDEMEAAKAMLEGLQLNVNIYEMELLIGEQEKLIGKEEKTYEGLQRDSVKLEQVLLETQASLDENKADQSNQRSKISTEKERLETFKLQLDELRNRKDNPDGTIDDEILDALDEEGSDIIEEDGDDGDDGGK
ncbi:MAG: hypothetical protein MRZ79_03760 [Bacteroidia bacterium]|nr:hypothetical protein [Bacteroidia bacterium]